MGYGTRTVENRTGGSTLDSHSNGVPALARGPVFALAATVGAVLFALSGRYGYFGDELYYIAAGRRPDWGYADQPPLIPLLARVMDTLFPGSLMGFRLPATIATAVGVVVAALLARELGGRARAQLLTAVAYAICPVVLMMGHILTPYTIDPVIWSVIIWLLVRWVRLRDDRLLLWLGLATAVALQGRYLIVSFGLALAAGVLLAGPRDLPRRRMFWIAVSVVAAAALPGVLWQATHGWPQLEMGRVVAAEVASYGGGRLLLIPKLLDSAGVLFGLVLAAYGLWRLLRSPHLRPYRFVGWTFVALTAIVIAAGGRYYYLAGMLPALYAAGAVGLQQQGLQQPGLQQQGPQQRRPAWWWRWAVTWPVAAASALLAVVTSLPVYAPSELARVPGVAGAFRRGETGWPELARAAAKVYSELPPPQRQDAVVVTHTYWQASAVEKFGVPTVYSSNRGYWYFGPPPDDAGTVVFVGADEAYLRRYFGDVRLMSVVDNPTGLSGANDDVAVWLCERPTAPWSRLWPRLRRLA